MKEQNIPGSAATGAYFTATAERTKTLFNINTGVVSWESGDSVSIWGQSMDNIPFIALEGGETTSLFNKDSAIVDSDVYYAAYPYSKDNDISEGVITLTIPSVQTVHKNSFAINPSVAKSDGTSRTFHFSNICGLLGFEIQKENIARVILTSNSGENLCGKITVDMNNADSLATTIVSGSTTISLVREYLFEPGVYYVAMLPQTFAKGVSITMVDDEGNISTKHRTKEFTLERSQALLPSVVDGGSFTSTYHIANATQLQAFLSSAPLLPEATEAVLDCNIDLNGVTLVPASSYSGTFNGYGFSLMNWTTDSALFFELGKTGTVKNLTIDNSCQLNIRQDDARVAFIVRNNIGTISNCINNASVSYDAGNDLSSRIFGTIVAYSTGYVSECVNNGDVTMTSDIAYVSAHQRIGGVVGAFASEGGKIAVENCKNYGKISYTSTNTGATTDKRYFINLGGVVGVGAVDGSAAKCSVASNLGIVSGCENYGEIYSSIKVGISGNYTNTGGVAGYMEGDIKNCTNNGKVTLDVRKTERTASRPAVGGVAGTVVFSSYQCQNKGEVNVIGSFGAGTSDATFAGGCHLPCFGGVFGCVGPTGASTLGTMRDCTNEGKLSVDVLTGANTDTYYLSVGGVSGYCSVPVQNSTNKSNVDVKSDYNITYFGGIVGYDNSSISTSVNEGDLSLNLLIDAEDGKRSAQALFGGIAGKMFSIGSGSINKSKNIGNLTMVGGTDKTTSTYTSASCIGGLVGANMAKGTSSEGSTEELANVNRGAINVNSRSSCLVGGVIGGCHLVSSTDGTNLVKNCMNFGNVNVTKPGAYSRIGGILGYQYKGNFQNLEVNCDITVSDAVDTTIYCGSILGMIKTTSGAEIKFISSTVDGSITVTGNSRPNLVAGMISLNGSSCPNKVSFGAAGSELYFTSGYVFNGTAVNDVTTVPDSDFAWFIPSATSKTSPGTMIINRSYTLTLTK